MTALRLRLGVRKAIVDLREAWVIASPNQFEREEVRLVWTRWLGSIALLALVFLLLSALQSSPP